MYVNAIWPGSNYVVRWENTMERYRYIYFFFQAEDGIRDVAVTGVQTCALPIYPGINAKVQPGEGERQCRAGYRRDRQAQPIRYLRPGLGSNQRGPGESRHQRFTKALKPAASRPFRAAAVALHAAHGPSCTPENVSPCGGTHFPRPDRP